MAKGKDILNEAEEFVSLLFKDKLPPKCLYHNLNHTIEVVKVSKEIGEHYQLKDEEMEVLLLASWLHDTGFTETYENHEEQSATIAGKFLKNHDYSDKKIEAVKKLILSTKHTHKPDGLLEEIIHDADITPIGKKKFFTRGELLRLEWEHFKNKVYDKLEWEKIQLDFLVNNNFLTLYAKEKFNDRRAINIGKQRENILDAHKKLTRIKTGKDFGRGIDTLYRVSYNSHISLSSIADGKANMMISINTIILSVIVTLSGAGFTLTGHYELEHIRYTLPIFILMLGSLVSVIFAVISTRPKVTQLESDKKKVLDRKSSLLYFGSFINVELPEFITYLSELKKDQSLLYDNMSIDLYYLGIVLKKKYDYLYYSYNAFMIGLIISVVGFIGIFFYTRMSA